MRIHYTDEIRASGELYVLFFALAAGVLISLMAVFNGRLTAEAGLCLTTAIIHVVAIIFALIILWIKKESFIPKQ